MYWDVTWHTLSKYPKEYFEFTESLRYCWPLPSTAARTADNDLVGADHGGEKNNKKKLCIFYIWKKKLLYS
jgi:hypothetical protein